MRIVPLKNKYMFWKEWSMIKCCTNQEGYVVRLLFKCLEVLILKTPKLPIGKEAF